MGLLDDAIREHLDLKRRRGADPAEVERAEREALGPVRRNREPGEMLDPAEPMAVEGGVAYEKEEDWAHDALPPEADVPAPVADAAAPAPEPLVHDPAPPVMPPAADLASRPELIDQPGASRARDDPFADRAHDDPFAEPPREPVAPSSHRDETAAYNVPGHLEEEEDADMLEETPEFLQDTPDHDRLWFEQRPPRDFDFDG